MDFVSSALRHARNPWGYRDPGYLFCFANNSVINHSGRAS